MNIRFWSNLLILICGMNAVCVNGFAQSSENCPEAVSFVSPGVSAPSIDSTVSSSDSDHASLNAQNAEHQDSQGDDCSSHQGNCHTCHLGHCSFLVPSVSGLIAPVLVRTVQTYSSFSCLSVDLSGLKRPPRA